MAKTNSRVPKSLRKGDSMKTKTGKLKLSTLSMDALVALKKTTKDKNMSKVNKEIEKRLQPKVITPLIKPLG